MRIMGFDFPSVFNTIWPMLLRAAWVLDCFTNQSQYTGIQDCELGMVVCYMGPLQGTVLALFLFILHTAEFTYNLANIHQQRFSDDSANVTDGDDREYTELTQGFVDWCQWDHLQIDAGLVGDFCRCKHAPPIPVKIQQMDNEIVKSYKNLTSTNSKLHWT